MLFVDDHEPELVKLHGILNQRVCTHDDLRISAFDALEHSLFFGTLAATYDKFHAIAHIFKHSSCRKEVLSGKDFSRCHQRHLAAVLDNDRSGLERHNRLPTSDVAFEQSVHGKGTFEVPGNIPSAA